MWLKPIAASQTWFYPADEASRCTFELPWIMTFYLLVWCLSACSCSRSQALWNYRKASQPKHYGSHRCFYIVVMPPRVCSAIWQYWLYQNSRFTARKYRFLRLPCFDGTVVISKWTPRSADSVVQHDLPPCPISALFLSWRTLVFSSWSDISSHMWTLSSRYHSCTYIGRHVLDTNF